MRLPDDDPDGRPFTGRDSSRVPVSAFDELDQAPTQSVLEVSQVDTSARLDIHRVAVDDQLDRIAARHLGARITVGMEVEGGQRCLAGLLDACYTLRGGQNRCQACRWLCALGSQRIR